MSTHQVQGPRALLLLACSGTKLDRPAPAIELYRGVMYSTYRAHVRADAAPLVVILSALHGFVPAGDELAPYDLRMTAERADDMLARLCSRTMGRVAWPREVGPVLLAGGAQYRRVMRAAIEALATCYGVEPASVQETSGAIGVQRSQLRRFLESL